MEADMSLSQSRWLIKAPDVLVQDLAGEAVLLNLRNRRYYWMNESSYHMYQTLISCGSMNAAYETLAGEYEVEPTQLKSDLDLLQAHLLENGLLVYAKE
jgi:hypothetical protein